MKKLNKNGSVLISAVTVVLLILIVLGVIFGVATSYQKRSIYEHARKQAYLNGISVVDAIAGEIAKGTDSSMYIPSNSTNNIKLDNIKLPSVTGKVSGVIELSATDSNILYIRITSTYNKQTEEVQLTMQKLNNVWYKKVYSQIGDGFVDEK